MQLSTSHMPSGLPSPTLTNPDLILPYNAPSPDSSPSSTRRAQRIPSPPPIDITNSVQDNGINGEGTKLQKSRKMDTVMPDAEQRHIALGKGTNDFSVLASSPILHDNYALPTAAPETLDEGDESQWHRFSGANDGDAMSPYSEELNDSVMDLGRPTYGFPPLDNEKNGFSAPPDVEDDDPYSHAAMSIRAEQILANAKKRLTNMEGNLNRARSTLHSRPSSSMSSFTNRDNEAVSLYTLPKANSSPSKHRQANTPPSAGSNKGHARVFSETSVPSTLNTPSNPRQDNSAQAPRSSSAMGSTSLEQAEDGNTENSRNWFWTGLTRNTSHAQRHNNALPALDEDGPAPASFEPPIAHEPITEDSEQQIVEPDQAAKSSEFDVQNPPAQGLTRARSTTQMRDLRDQMQDLKGKISSLKRKAREDSLRRRSLQSLRTPSPFTAAEQWYSDGSHLQSKTPTPPNDEERTSPESQTPHTEVEGGIARENGLPTSEKSESRTSPEADDKFTESNIDLTQRNITAIQVERESRMTSEDMSTSDQDMIQESNLTGEKDYQTSEEPPDSGVDLAEADSLYGDHDYHETSPSPIGERHEDRPDAFDYEHFFLHSGTGTLARKDLSRSSSRSSIYSVETTKPSHINDQSSIDDSEESSEATPKKASSSRHERKDSVESISTVATYATATEGGEDGSASEDEWILHHPIAGSWQSDHKRKHGRSANTDTVNGSVKRHATSRSMASTNGEPVPAVPSPYRHEAASTQGRDLLVLLQAALDDGGQGKGELKLSEGDRDLVEKLVKSLAKVCERVQAADKEESRYEGRVWRRRLDSARRVLDGEMNGEPF